MRVFLVTGLTFVCAVALASEAPKSTDMSAIQAAVQKVNPGSVIESPSETPIKGLYQTSIDGINGYVTADGRYFVSGDLFDVAQKRNLAEDGRKAKRLAMIAKADTSEAITFSPAKAKHTITVFTDVECGYCRKLHSEIEKYNAEGIAVRYLAFPRSGPGSEGWKQMEQVWCSKDRRDALTRAKRSEKIDAGGKCETKAVAGHYVLGEKLHLQGTPMIVLEDGAVIGGYIPPAALAAKLRDAGERHAKAQ